MGLLWDLTAIGPKFPQAMPTTGYAGAIYQRMIDKRLKLSIFVKSAVGSLERLALR
ncbi:MAG: hypothetical protein KME60_03595 [Cyanomargarita calcarea GSE-NOS-MK-12-04C]|uniref:Uncharacterized protein n=1 Tax=Cyanomargarita calcarea GSE-NOS-MK-12-04C TaxID=2839659 RepID=A0A951UT95_9CYAN|nr:hypothetical protein [Cyanomargarita calcarea GSE-NOS-MK-12-04C]